MSEKTRMTPDQLQWVLDHNMQIRAGHRVQIAHAVDAWREDLAQLAALRASVAALGYRENELTSQATQIVKRPIQMGYVHAVETTPS